MALKETRLTGLLYDLEDLLDGLGSPFSSYALPGIDDDEIDRLLAPVGLVAPTELREWWRWHRGSRTDRTSSDRHTLGPGSWGLMDIPWALRDRELWLKDMPGDDDQFGWTEDWLPFAWSGFDHGRLVARLGESTSDEVCVGWWYVFDVCPEEPVARSLAEMVENFIRVLREGQICWNPEGRYSGYVGGWEEGPRWEEFPRYLGL